MKKKKSYSEAGMLGWLAGKEKHEARHKAFRDKYEANPKQCKHCETAIPYEKRRNKCCSHSCAVFVHNFGRKGVLKAKTYRTCLNCGLKTSNEKYCSSQCHADFRWNQTKLAIEKKQKITTKKTGYTNISHAKRYLTETKGHKCEICEIKTWMGKKLLLILDHIDGDSGNWKLSNLRLICSNCDAQTDTYKARNVGKGRYSRRKRYAQGKSF